MIVLDTSALVAVLNDEPDGPHFYRAMLAAETVYVSTATWVEIEIVVDRKLGAVGRLRLNELLLSRPLTWASVDREQARIATEAHRRYGRGSGHPARLNFGDCFSYALASGLGIPLLFKGEDFIHTDIAPALRP